MNAVVTAGGRIDAAYAAQAGTRIKALAPVFATTMLDRALDALRGAGVERIALVGGAQVRTAAAQRVERFIDEGDSGSENVLRALHAWSDRAGPLLYLTSDLPYVTAEAIRDFVERAAPEALALAVTEFADFTRRFPGAPPFGLSLAGERIVNGGAFLFPEGSHARIALIAARLFDLRKRPWGMATLVSPMTLLRFAFRTLTIAQLETQAQRLAGIAAQAVRGCAPELAYDADLLEEYRYACTHA